MIMAYDVVLWGLGNEYRARRNYLKLLEKAGVLSIKGVFSSDDFEMAEIDGWAYYTYKEISKIHFDYIIVLNEVYEQAIINDLLEAGIEREKILPGRILSLPSFDFEKYIKLKNSKISIISRTCLGGMLSRTVGLEYLSPFRNMNIEEEDYMKLLNDFDTYMSYELVDSGEQLFNDSEQIYFPVMLLNDVKVRYPHFKSAEQALSDWNARKNRINRSNLFVMNITESKEVAERFSRLKFQNKVCFTNFKSDIPNTIYLPPCRSWKSLEVEAHLGVGGGLFVDPVRLLLGEENVELFF